MIRRPDGAARGRHVTVAVPEPDDRRAVQHAAAVDNAGVPARGVDGHRGEAHGEGRSRRGLRRTRTRGAVAAHRRQARR